MHPLTRVQRATVKRRAAEAEWRAAIRAAVAGGSSHRAVAEAAGVTHTRVQQILRGE
jgi:plasmid stability protein